MNHSRYFLFRLDDLICAWDKVIGTDFETLVLLLLGNHIQEVDSIKLYCQKSIKTASKYVKDNRKNERNEFGIMSVSAYVKRTLYIFFMPPLTPS